jgi:hypothetical protein
MRVALLHGLIWLLVLHYMLNNMPLPDYTKDLDMLRYQTIRQRDVKQKHALARKTSPVPLLLDTYNGSVSLGISLLTCSRPEELDMTLQSLHTASSNAPSDLFKFQIYLSLDCTQRYAYDQWIHLLKWQRIMKDMLNVTHSVQIDTPADPKFRDERVARHFLGNLKRVFDSRENHTHVMHMEDDHVVSPDFFPSLLRLIRHSGNEGGCLNMGCHRDCRGALSPDPDGVIRMEARNMGVVYSRELWNNLTANIGAFCAMRGNWDMNIHILQSRGKLANSCLTYVLPRIQHLPTRVSSRTGQISDGRKDWGVTMLALASQQQELNASKALRDLGRAEYVLEDMPTPAPEALASLCMSVFVTGQQ